MSYTNVASVSLVEKFNLKVLKHPKPYSFQCLSDGGEINVTDQVKVSITVGRYIDEVFCEA